MTEDLGQRLAQVLTEHEVVDRNDLGQSQCLCTLGDTLKPRWYEPAEYRAHLIQEIAKVLQVTETEEHGFSYGDEPEVVKKAPMDYIERKVSAKHGDKIYRRTIINIPHIVGEWEEVHE